jgi:hypothetical protein
MKKHNIDHGSSALSDRDSHKHMQGHGEPTKTGSCGAAIGNDRAVLTVRKCATGEVIEMDQDTCYALLCAAFAQPRLRFLRRC